MITVQFPDRENEKRALGLLMGHFSGKVFRSGYHFIPIEAIELLVEQKILFKKVKLSDSLCGWDQET